MWIILLNLTVAVYWFSTICCKAEFVELPAFQGIKTAGASPLISRRDLAGDRNVTEKEHKLHFTNDSSTTSSSLHRRKGEHFSPYPEHDVKVKNDNKLEYDDSEEDTDSDYDSDSDDDDDDEDLTTEKHYPPVKERPVRNNDYFNERPKGNYRRHWLVSEPTNPTYTPDPNTHDDKDGGLKSKIMTLVQQTMHDTDMKVRSIQGIKEKYRDKAPYRIGFILSMVKKSRDVLNELFNVAVKHRDEWKALEQLKIFELIVHTNVDTTNLVRQLVELHIQNLNSTQKKSRLRMGNGPTTKQRIVILR